jgi:hypothetical protein
VGALVALALVVVVVLIVDDGGNGGAASDPGTTTTTDPGTTTTDARTTPPDTTTTTAPDTTTTTAPDTTTTTAANTTTTTAANTTTTESGTTTTIPTFSGDTRPKDAGGEAFNTFAFLADVRFAQREEGFTRIVFDFEGEVVPWWRVEYDPGPFFSTGDDPDPVAVGGTDHLLVVLAATGYDITGAEVRITYSGPERIPVASQSVVEVVRIDDFEGVSAWVIGVEGRRPFRVGTLEGPPRIYIDVAD